MSPSPPARLSVPWRVGDLTVVCALAAVGLIGVVAGWVGASGTEDLRTEEVWLAVAIGFAVIAGVGNALWLLAGHRAVRGRMRLAAAELARRLPVASAPAPVAPPVADRSLVASPAMTHFHRRSCHLAQGKPVTARTAAQHRKAGRRACGACRPLEPVA